MSAIPYTDPRVARIYAEEYSSCIEQHMPEDRARFWAEHAAENEMDARGPRRRDVERLAPPANASEIVEKIRQEAARVCRVDVDEFRYHPQYFKADPPKRLALTRARRWVLVAARTAFGATIAGQMLDTNPSWVRGAETKLIADRPDLVESAEAFGMSLRPQP